MSETALLKRIQLALAGRSRLFRNNVGRLKAGDRYVQYGLCPGSADLVGWKTIQIGGRKVAVFCAIEVKTPEGTLTQMQKDFLNAVQEAGGIAFVARSVEEALHEINQY